MKFKVKAKMLTLPFSLFVVLIFVVSCQSGQKRSEERLEKAQKLLEPLDDYQSLTCTVKVKLPESFKTQKKQELAQKKQGLESWQALFDYLEERDLRWHLSRRGCWIKGLPEDEKKFDDQQNQFLKNVAAQMQLGNCVLLQSFYYRSPLAGRLVEKFNIYPQDPDAILLKSRDNEKAHMNWDFARNELRSSSVHGDNYIARYSGEGEDLKLAYVGIENKSHRFGLENLGYQQLNSGALLVSEYLMVLKKGDAAEAPQMRVNFDQCVARVQRVSGEDSTRISD